MELKGAGVVVTGAGFGPSGSPGGPVLDPEVVADEVMKGLEGGRFRILPHGEVRDHRAFRASDTDRCCAGCGACVDVSTTSPRAERRTGRRPVERVRALHRPPHSCVTP
ncbi:hypothetical protein [Streptomyces sp. WMMC940]|uniref:hypothetical protein n=1 Tax=Streptomyces sp. WMMC940 TaxID=3015153 RepID=UPI0022B6A3D9|nr:hypothetical protein [Streptomyces sp. WMMC940]MCZ7457190.1 hypothetical protein [Streptomyces sp. WMMC940]